MSLSLAACVLLTVVAEPGKFAVDAAVAPSRILGCAAIWFNGQVQRTTEATAAKCKAAATMVNRCQTSW